jgi:hypothetical protein
MRGINHRSVDPGERLGVGVAGGNAGVSGNLVLGRDAYGVYSVHERPLPGRPTVVRIPLGPTVR